MPPDLILFDDFNGDWRAYEERIFEVFFAEIARGRLTFQGRRVSCRRNPETAGRWASFWHLVQEGPVEQDRHPDLRRCERIPWIKWIIDNAGSHPHIDQWRNCRGTEVNVLLWYQEEYLVVLSERGGADLSTGYWLLKTAYCTERRRRVEKLRQERDRFFAERIPGSQNG